MSSLELILADAALQVWNQPINYNPYSQSRTCTAAETGHREMKKPDILKNPLISMVNRYSVKRNNILKS